MSTIDNFVDRTLHADSGDEIGKIRDVLLHPTNLEPEWLVVKTGWRSGEHLVPIVAVSEQGDTLVVPYSKTWVDASPRARDHAPPPTAEAKATYQHYGLESP